MRSTDPIDRTVRELARRIPGPLLRPAGMLLEVRHGLQDATEAHRASGLDERSAAARAVADFGDLDEVAGAYAEQAVVRSTTLAALALGPGYLAILAVWTVTNLTGRGTGADPTPAPEAASMAFRYLGALAAVVAVCALLELRRRSRIARSSRPMAILVGACGLLTSCASLAAAYAVGPWQWNLAGRAGQETGVAEAFSAAVTVLTIALAARCLLTLVRLRPGCPRSSA
ncbi:MAG TPA: permease prefix domain 1-containing protein [Propionibacteriaceae bacterium]